MIAGLLVTNDAPRDEAGDLLEHHPCGRSIDGSFHRDGVLLVGVAGLLLARHQEAASLIAHVSDLAGDRRAVYMHVEEVEENAQPVAPAAGLPRAYFPTGRRHGPRPRRNLALRIAKEVQTKRRQDV